MALIVEGREKWLEIFFEQNQYPCSLIGVTAVDEGARRYRIKGGVVDTDKIYFCAHGHHYESGSCSVLEAADYIREAGAHNALTFDEGNDVFQLASWRRDHSELEETVPLRKERTQLRCVFWAHEKVESAPNTEDFRATVTKAETSS